MLRRISVGLIALLCFVNPCLTWTHGQSSGNALGVNLNGVTYYSPGQQFINIFKTSTQYGTQNSGGDTGEEDLLCLDANGYVTTMTEILTTPGGSSCTATPMFTHLSWLFNAGLSSPYYQAGNYDVYYNPGGCTFSYNFDASLVSQNVAAGHDVFNVATPSVNGISMALTAMGTGSNYCQNVSVTLSSLTASYQAGAIFNPVYLSRISPFRAFRFMDWMCTNSNANAAAGTWAGRPLPTTIFYGSNYGLFGATGLAPVPCGVPVEVMVSLCNTLNADCWFNMPTLATNDYVTQFATYVAANLNPNLHAYMEYSNETWNYGFSQATQLVSIGQALWGTTACGPASYICNRSVMGMQTATFCSLWKTAFGAASGRVNCVLGSQAADTGEASNAFACPLWSGAPCTGYGIGYVGIAPYFGTDAGTSLNPCYDPSWLSQPDGGLTDLFTAIEIGGNLAGFPCEPPGDESLLKLSSDWEVSYQSIASTYGVKIVAYESGQQFTSISYDPQFTNLFVAAQTDPRMGTAYTNYYNTWAANGGQLAMHFNDVSGYGKYGSWGALQQITETSSPKYDALLGYISGAP